MLCEGAGNLIELKGKLWLAVYIETGRNQKMGIQI